MAAMQFFVMDELTGQQTGPFSLHQIQEQILTRKLKKNDFVRRADSPNWGKASVILAQVFDNVEQHKKDKKQQLKADKVAKKQQEANSRSNEKKERQRAADVPQVQTTPDRSGPQDNYKPTFGRMLFGSTRPSPYAGFKFVSLLINVAIVIVLLVLCLGTGFVLVTGIYGLTVLDLAEENVLLLVGQFVAALGVLWLYCLILIGLLIFQRNLIDWLIDVEEHARAIRKHFRA